MANSLKLQVVSPECILLEAEVSSVRFPGEDGLFGVLPRHAAMVALTDSGSLTATTTDGKSIELVIHDGFAEVRDDQLTILTRAAEKPEDIDPARAQQAAERARARLKRGQKAEIDYVRAQAALRRALLRERLARRG